MLIVLCAVTSQILFDLAVCSCKSEEPYQ